MNSRAFSGIMLTLLIMQAYMLLAISIVPVSGLETTLLHSVDTLDGSFRVRGYGKYRVTIYYPADRSGAPYPAVVFAHGLLACKSWYTWIGEHLASEGYIVLMFTVPERASPDVFQWVKGIKGGISYLHWRNRCWFSPLFKRVNTCRIAVMGHSMGAMASFIVAGNDPRVETVIALAPVYLGFETGSEIIDSIIANIDWEAILSAAKQITKPIQIQVGTKDRLAWHNAENYFIETRGDELVFIEGGNHVGYMDDVPLMSTILPLLGLVLDLPQEIQLLILRNLDLFFGGDGDGDGDGQTLISLAVRIWVDNPLGISVEEQHQWAMGNATLWLEIYL